MEKMKIKCLICGKIFECEDEIEMVPHWVECHIDDVDWDEYIKEKIKKVVDVNDFFWEFETEDGKYTV